MSQISRMVSGGVVVIPTSFTTDSGTAVPAANILQIIGGTGVSTSGATNIVTINASGGGLGWINVTTTPTALTADTGHYISTAGLCTLTLPSSPAADTIIRIVGVGAGGWIVNCGAGETIYYGVLTSTTGVGGSIESSDNRDCLTLKYLGSDNWQGIDSVGNLGVT